MLHFEKKIILTTRCKHIFQTCTPNCLKKYIICIYVVSGTPFVRLWLNVRFFNELLWFKQWRNQEVITKMQRNKLLDTRQCFYLRGYCIPDQFCDCLCIFLKNYNTMVTSKICFL